MSWIAAAAGVLLIVVAMVDAVWTTLTTGGGGPLTSRLTRVIWQTALLAMRRTPLQAHHALAGLGTVMLLVIMTVWIVLLWLGWTLLFSAGPTSVLHSQTLVPADLTSLTYFTGYTLFTLGVGNYVPNGGFWEIMTAVASLNGLTLITLSITYLVPVVSAAVQKRELAATVYALGDTPQKILIRAWNGSEFAGLSNHLSQLLSTINMHTQRHAAYPILHYFHSPQRRTAASPNLAALDEALLIMSTAVQPEKRLPTATIEPVQAALEGLMSTLSRQYIQPDTEPPPIPDLRSLREAGIPLVGDAELRRAAKEREDHRNLLRAFVQRDGWEWSDVMTSGDPESEAAAHLKEK